MKQTFTETLKQVFLGQDLPPAEDAVTLLKEDHDKVEGLFKQFQEAEQKSERRSLLDKIITELTVHATLEEKFVYPILLSEKTTEKTQEAYEEHHVVKLLLAELEHFSGGEDNIKAKVKVLEEMIKHHIKEEELDLLPKLKDHDVDLDELGATLKREKKKLLGELANLKKQTQKEAEKGIATGNGSGKPAKSSPTSQKTDVKKAVPSSTAGETMKKPVAKKAATKKPVAVAKKATAKKPATKKPAAKKATMKKAAPKKPEPKKPAAKKATVKKAAPKKTAAKKAAPKKTAPKKTAASSRLKKAS